jgi:hypothetical protein
MTRSPTVQRPSDLASLVHSYLLGGVDARHRGVTEMPAMEILVQLFDALFYLSISSEEGQQIVCSAAFTSPPLPRAESITIKKAACRS